MSAGGDGTGGGLGGVQGGRNTPPRGSPTPMDKATLKVHLPNGQLHLLLLLLTLLIVFILKKMFLYCKLSLQ